MPARTRPAAPTAMEVMEEEAHNILPGLQFNEPLSWRAGRPIAIADLLQRLQALSREMREMEQEENERDSFTKVAKELASPNLLAHKDKGVRAWTACCLVDILRLCAPDAPYTGPQLRDIFTLLVTGILPALSDPSNAYNSQHMYVLQSLAQVKSIVLLTDIPSSESLILHLFVSFFDMLSGSSRATTGEQLAKNVEFNLTAILEILVDESTSLPPEVIDIIMAQFLRADPHVVSSNGSKSKRHGIAAVDEKQSTLVLKELPPAYNMAKSICNSCTDKMARYVSQYFNDVIMDASATSAVDGVPKNRSHRRSSLGLDDSDEEVTNGPTEDDMKELHKAHRLLRELWRASPGVLQNVIPQLEAELSAENVQLRLLATESLGDIVSGIGAAGPPLPPSMDPAAYPPRTITAYTQSTRVENLLTTPCSPQPFPHTHPGAYSNFLGRRQDKSALIRSAWTTGIGRILTTSAGGVGLSQHEEERLVSDLARMLGDGDEKVRIAAVKAVGDFDFRDAIFKLGSSGGISKPGSLLGTLAERVRDRKHAVRVEAMRVLGRIWGVGAGEIAAGEDQVMSLIGDAPSKILDTFYTNDMEINVLLDHVLFELLLPLSYPPIKSKGSKTTNGNSQRVKDSQTNGEPDAGDVNPDKLRTERVLVLVKNLDEKAKRVFFALQARQVTMAKILATYLKRCENYNGGVMDENEKDIKAHLTRLIDNFARQLPDPARVTADLWKFAKMHDRRSYQLIRFCIAPESDYRTVFKAIKEFSKRIEAAPGAPAGMLETLTPLLYRSSVLVYNKSHVPAIMEFSRNDEHILSGTAHEVLKEISSKTPEVFKAHIQELCKVIEEQAPKAKKSNEAGAVDTLKACAGFARKFPQDLPKDRKFLQSLTEFALHGTPAQAAKHAVSIIMAVAERKEMHAKDLVQRGIKEFKYGSGNFLSQLATLSQLVLLAPREVDEESDAVVDIAINQILLKVRSPSKDSEYEWQDKVDDECEAKMWALKVLVNRLRSHNDPESLAEIAKPVHRLLKVLITEDGELSKAKDTPSPHKPHLRLLAAQLYLKLCTNKIFNEFLTPLDFNHLALVAQDVLPQVRLGFINKLKKYLGQNKLPQRFYTIIFLLAFDPQSHFREDTLTWIRSRSAFFAQQKSTVMESVFARLLSLLAHHPDYGTSADDLLDSARYIMFFLKPVATEQNLSLIYHIAQRVKQKRDAISSDMSENLYHLSDLAQAIIRRYEEVHGWSLQTFPQNLRLPSELFATISNDELAQEIARTKYLPEGLEERLETLVKAKAKTKIKKRKSDEHDDAPAKKKSKSATTTTPSASTAASK
ncbi:MAG: hypothetical protein M1830_002474, partial [Pleopsidium flavum]